MSFYYTDMAKKYILNLLLLMTLTVLGSSAWAQNLISVRGKVVDKGDGSGIPAVTIMASTATRAIGMTRDDGSFTVSVADNATLTFKYLNYKDVTVKLNGKNDLKIVMVEDLTTLDEVKITVGYGQKTKETVMGAVTSLRGKDIQDVPVSNVAELFQAKVPGLNIQNNTGSPGAAPSINMRGLSGISVTGSGDNAFLTPTSPLFVIDGVPVDLNTDYQYGFSSNGPGISPLSLIPAEDIEEILFLKDASATALYGAQGAYGVILINTRRGKSKTPIIQYSTNFFFNTPPKLRQVIGGAAESNLRLWEIYTYGANIYSARQSVDNTPMLADSLNAFYNNSTDWQSIFYRSTYNQQHNVNASGGDDSFNYKINLGYYDEKGIQENTGFTRYSLSMNTRYKPSPKFNVNLILSSSLGNSQKGSGNGILQTGVAAGAGSSSLLPGPNLINSNAALGALIVDNDNKAGNIKTSVEARYEFLTGLAVSNITSYDYSMGTTETFNPAILNNNVAGVYSYNDKRSTLYNRAMVSFNKSLQKDVHNIGAYVFSEVYVRNFQAHAIQQDQYTNDQYQGPFGTASASSLGGVLDNYSDSRAASLAASLSYNYKTKYLIEATFRLDGTSSTGLNAPWAKNPSLALKWNFNKENFLADSKWLDVGMLRLSWGRNIAPVGNVFDANGTYDYYGNYNGIPTTAIDFNNLPNIKLLPTTTTQYNAGLDLNLFKNRITLNFDTYYKMVDNQLWEKNITTHNAFTKLKTNEVSNVNYGYELALSFRPLPASSKVNWSVSINGAYNKEKITALPDATRQLLLDGGATGQAILYRLGRNSLTNILYNFKGVFSTDDDVPVNPANGTRYHTFNGSTPVYFKAGDPYYADINGDYVLDAKDMVGAGNSQPLINGGISSYASYKGFSLNVIMAYTWHRDILNNPLAASFQNFSSPFSANNLVPITEYNIWRQSGDIANYPNPYDYLRYGSYSATDKSTQFLPFRYNQTLFQEDGSYLKLATVTVGYTFKPELTKRLGITSLRVYGTANNIHTFSFYSGADPENVSSLGRDNSGGYPVRRTYALGLNIQL
ncbi:SusC/RagA family TonB-linked outer membrane protein [Pedobacter sp. R-06]|uniref:SusC/RagA family TonB-linked outer membrane protein n=1 Tax=Pedobacter sp. R-06 TaxID=3404051 RepID=UPI003CF1380D